jgi:5-hydroxyisourate hydrolase-like protein (transthyretin family)
VNAVLQPGGWLRGRVTDANTGKPLAGVGVDATVLGSDYTFPNGVQTNAGGEYSYGPLPTGTYAVGFQPLLDAPHGDSTYAPEYYDEHCGSGPIRNATGVPLTAPQTVRLDEALHVGGVITGRVTDAQTGAPVSGVRVTAYTADPCQQIQYTGADGTYQMYGMFAGTYKVSFYDGRYVYWNNQSSSSTATPISVAFGTTTSGIDASLTRSG